MKRSFYALGLMLAATFTLTNCAKEIDSPVQEPESAGIPFEIMASAVDTKTTNDGLSTVWAEGDAMNVFHAETGAATYVNNGQFTYGVTENGNFAGTLAAELTAEAYDWYAFYPYSSYIKTPANTSSGYMPVGSKFNAVQTQTGNDSMAHIAGENYPMWGIAENVAVGETPTIIMTHLTSLIAVEVINEIPTGDDLTVESVSFTAPEGVDIVGTYYIDFSTSTPGFTGSGDNYVSSTAKLSVEEGTPIAVDESAKFYIAVKPFTAEAGATLELNVNGYSKTLTLQNDAVFTPGKIKNVSFAYDQAPVEVEALSLPWYEDFSSDLSKYVIIAGTSSTVTQIYEEDNLAGGVAPELLLAKNNGALKATFVTEGFSGNLDLEFVSNHADYVSVTASEGVEVTKNSDSEYILTIPESIETFDVVFTNVNTSNTRIDNISLRPSRAVQTLSFEVDKYDLAVGTEEMTSFAGQAVTGAMTEVTYSSNNSEVAVVDAETGIVSLTGTLGIATITASAVGTDEYKPATAQYAISVTDPSVVKVEKEITFDFGADEEVGFSTWASSYAAHTASYEMATVSFESANKQSGTITDCPVTKGKSVSIVMNGNRTIKAFELTLSQWTTKAQTVTLNYSTDGGISYTKSSITSSNFSISSDDLASIAEGINAIKFTFSSTSNQVGIKTCYLKYDE